MSKRVRKIWKCVPPTLVHFHANQTHFRFHMKGFARGLTQGDSKMAFAAVQSVINTEEPTNKEASALETKKQTNCGFPNFGKQRGKSLIESHRLSSAFAGSHRIL